MKKVEVDNWNRYNGKLIREGYCPHCGSDNWETLDQGIDDEIYYYNTECNSCGGKWTDIYRMTFSSMIIEEK